MDIGSGDFLVLKSGEVIKILEEKDNKIEECEYWGNVENATKITGEEQGGGMKNKINEITRILKKAKKLIGSEYETLGVIEAAIDYSNAIKQERDKLQERFEKLKADRNYWHDRYAEQDEIIEDIDEARWELNERIEQAKSKLGEAAIVDHIGLIEANFKALTILEGDQ